MRRRRRQQKALGLNQVWGAPKHNLATDQQSPFMALTAAKRALTRPTRSGWRRGQR